MGYNPKFSANFVSRQGSFCHLQTDQIASVVVPDYQLSLAIGKEGQNVRLAAKLTGWKIDITSESQSPEAKMPKENPLPDDSSETVEDSEAAEINISETGADAAMEADDFENP